MGPGPPVPPEPLPDEHPRDPVYEGIGLHGRDRGSGECNLYWFDTFGLLDHLKGQRDGDRLVMHSEGPMGKNRTTLVLPEEGEATFLYERMWPGAPEFAPFLGGTGKKRST